MLEQPPEVPLLLSSLLCLLTTASIFIFYNFSPPPQVIASSTPRETLSSWEGNERPPNLSGIECTDPSTGAYITTITPSTPTEVKESVKKSRIAQSKYSTTTFSQRVKILRTLYSFIVANKDTIGRISARDTGKTLLDAQFGEIIPTLEKLLWTIQNGPASLSPESRQSGRISVLTSARVEYYPIGVMGLIVSWNYPFHNVISPLISALMAGNGCVVKCSEQTAWTSKYLEKVVHDILQLHGVDTDLVAFCNGYADAGQALVESADKITFIGSPDVGKIVMKVASQTLTPVILELGGKDAAVVFADCAYSSMFSILMRAALQNAGQNCAGLERVILEDAIYERFETDAKKIYQELRVGCPFDDDVDVGAITMRGQINIVKDLVDDAIGKGARAVCGGSVFEHPKHSKGQYFQPTILADITPEMRIYHEEVFGPIILLLRFTTEKQAVELVNATEFGLGSSVFSVDYEKAERMTRQFKTGMSNVNGWGFNYLCQSLPFGGVGKSGFDRFAGIEGLRGNCNVRAATTDKFGLLGIRTSVPGIIDFPLRRSSVVFQSALIDILYGEGIAMRIGGINKIVQVIFGVI